MFNNVRIKKEWKASAYHSFFASYHLFFTGCFCKDIHNVKRVVSYWYQIKGEKR